ncbi:MAG: PIN domain-containing protein, partial [bacterium]
MDTNLWVYLYSNQPEKRYSIVRQIIEENFENIVSSTQVLGELYFVLTRKKFRSKAEAKEIIIEMITTFPILEVNSFSVMYAMDICEKYK